ncbi:L-lysine 6-monooxygenase (NADPH-requiring) [Fragilaria crotonensis]|nr:L-lysine 6-monooxygenase (NADPH-requiring) [Fragilaria crotonensis]
MIHFDVVIVGSGPAGLACLSGIQEQYSYDTLTEAQKLRAEKHCPCGARKKKKKQRVAVIDPSPQWMTQWRQHFSTLGITVLRSPALAHPDLFDSNALLAFATRHGRSSELIESGCGDMASLIPLGQTQVGLWKLPTASLFLDFCDDMTKRLPHGYICDSVVDISKESDNDEDEEFFHVMLESGNFVGAKAVILATGVVGYPSIPDGLKNAPNVISWTQLDSLLLSNQRNPKNQTTKPITRVLVVGGGLTAVQAALKCCSSSGSSSSGNTRMVVTLCSRRPLTERHFDLSLDWFDWRSSTKCMADFYNHDDYSQRLMTLRTSRGGGSVHECT